MNDVSTITPIHSLELIGLQHHGQVLEFFWVWPGAAIQVGFDQVMSAVPGIDTALLGHLRQCSLHRAGSALQPLWLLDNTSDEIVCSVNHRSVMVGQQIRLGHGDEIEIGLTRLRVALQPSDNIPARLPQTEPPDAENADAVAGSFALTDLDALGDASALSEAQRTRVDRSDFSDLISLQPDTELAPSPAAGTPQVATDVVKVGGARAAVPPQDPLDTLHALYLAKLRNPTHSDGADLWRDIVRGNQDATPDPMQQLMQAAGSAHSLDDLLGRPQSIAHVIAGLDSLGSADVLAPEGFDSVMHLFAPEHLRAEREESLESLVQNSLPGLTRREHHSLSLDSAMPFVGGEGEAIPSQSNPPRP